VTTISVVRLLSDQESIWLYCARLCRDSHGPSRLLSDQESIWLYCARLCRDSHGPSRRGTITLCNLESI